MRIHQYFIKNFLLIFVSTLFLTTIVTYLAIKEINLNHHKQFIKKQMELIKLQLPSVKNIDDFVLLIKKKTNYRLSIIDDDGVVIAESDYNKTEMDNLSERKEIKIARAQVDGYALRYSSTLNKDILYLASQSYIDKKPIFIRLALQPDSIISEFYQMWIKLTLIFIFFIFLGIYVMYRLSHKIEKEIGKVTNTLDNISRKNYKTAVDASFSKEFIDIEEHIEKLSKKLEKREKLKRKYTAKIKLISQQRSDIISAISHEFKNPIASVIGYAQTLKDDPHTNEKIRERFLEKIVTNTKKISDMIDRLSLATKFENGDLSPKKTDFNLYTLAKESTNNFQDKYPQRLFTCKGQNHTINADKTMIDLVITNLIDNAIKYSQGDIEILLEEKTLHIKDRGIGIDNKEIEKVTNKFYRSDTLTWDNSMGLGLAIVKHILNLHGAEIVIKSELGVGSDFSFEL